MLLNYRCISVEEIEGVGKVTATRLRSHGVECVEDILLLGSRTIAEIIGSEEHADKIFRSAVELLKSQGLYKSFMTALELLEYRSKSR